MSNWQSNLAVENSQLIASGKPPERDNESLKDEESHSSTPKLGDFHRLYKPSPSPLLDQADEGLSYLSAGAENSVNRVVNYDQSHGSTARGQVVKLGDFQRLQVRLHGQKPALDKTSLRGARHLSAISLKSIPAQQPCGGDTQQRGTGGENDDTLSAQYSGAQECSPFTEQDYHYSPRTSQETSCRHSNDLMKTPNDCASNDSINQGSDIEHIVDGCLESFLPKSSRHQSRGSLHRMSHRSEDRKANSLFVPTPEISKVQPIVSRIVSYQLDGKGPITPVLGQKCTLAQQHELLSLQSVPLRARDASLAIQDEQVARNGIHVFLDMSNINISFQNALRSKFFIKEHARFVPLPQLNLQFLTDILVRDRKIIALNAGCSVIPNRQEPRYVQELRDLGYRVDLRERKQAIEPTPRGYYTSKSGEASSSDDSAFPRVGTRYREELVDETLQNRIAESVMEFFQDQGTLVIATGDAKPAKYSDGFFVYAQRALRMGWNVEVVSWKISLSSYWNKTCWAEKWGARFRIIELDEYIDCLLV